MYAAWERAEIICYNSKAYVVRDIGPYRIAKAFIEPPVAPSLAYMLGGDFLRQRVGNLYRIDVDIY